MHDEILNLKGPGSGAYKSGSNAWQRHELHGLRTAHALVVPQLAATCTAACPALPVGPVREAPSMCTQPAPAPALT